jgi:predicted nucleic acid-binding protein
VTLVVDASIAVKWVVAEDGSPEALALQEEQSFAAPDLLAAEVGNVIWKKTRRGELTLAEASLAARTFATADVIFHPSLPMLDEAVRLAFELGHPAYDCFYLVLARELGTQLVTADTRLLARLAASGRPELRSLARPLA